MLSTGDLRPPQSPAAVRAPGVPGTWRDHPGWHFARRTLYEHRRAAGGVARRDPDTHLQAAEAWLQRAQDACDGGGVSWGYSLRGGWRAPYPETSGYIASTFFRLAARRADPRWRDRGLRIARWLLSVQNADGSVPNPRYGRQGIVFDTGQVLGGLLDAAAEHPHEPAWLDAAQRAGDWLVRVADARGLWTRCEFLDTPHVYNTRTAWALLRLDAVRPGDETRRVAQANLDWALASQTRGGLFEHCAFRRGDAPFTHTLAYVVEGLLEAGALLGSTRHVDAAARCLDALRDRLADDGFLAARFDVHDGRPVARYACLTGQAQLARCWARLHQLQGGAQHRTAAERALGYVMARQSLGADAPPVHGAIAGSFPVWGGYAPMSYPNWAAKFFVDAMWAVHGGART